MFVYHAIDPNDGLFCHNISINNGRITAVAFARFIRPEWDGMRSPYEVFTHEKEKEDIFEKIRKSEFENCPPRLGSIYTFPDNETAVCANKRWWNGRRVILEASVVHANRIGQFDSRYLDATRENWEASARAYWSGKFSEQPFLEVLIEGVIQLSGWEPYGRLFGGIGASR